MFEISKSDEAPHGGLRMTTLTELRTIIAAGEDAQDAALKLIAERDLIGKWRLAIAPVIEAMERRYPGLVVPRPNQTHLYSRKFSRDDWIEVQAREDGDGGGIKLVPWNGDRYGGALAIPQCVLEEDWYGVREEFAQQVEDLLAARLAHRDETVEREISDLRADAAALGFALIPIEEEGE